MGVAIGSILADVLTNDAAQGYLALTTAFKALLSTETIKVTHHISERVAFMLGVDEEERLSIYRQMKRLYKTRSQLVHGAIENKVGAITVDRLRLDAKFTIVPAHDYSDLFDLSVRLLKRVMLDPQLLRLLEKKKSGDLDEWYLRLGFRGCGQ
jgi:hypothetical protein